MHERTIGDLKAIHTGPVICLGEPGYEDGRRVWNAIIDRRPALIARCRTAADVSAAVNFARETGLPIAVRGGAHSVAGRGTCDDGIVIDLAEMRAIDVDPAARVVRAEGGVRWVELDRETQAFGLATTGGTVGDTGIAGLTLGGGFGWLEGRCGMACDNLVGADVVLANGELVHASATEHPDLFWALRGGGGNFGVVTAFEYRLHDVGPLIVGGFVMHPFDKAAEVLAFYRSFLADAPDELTAAAVLLTAPDGHRACAVMAAYTGDVATGERIVAPLKAFGSPILDIIGPMPYTAQQSLLDQAMPPNLLNYWKADFIETLSDEVIATAVTAFASVPSPLSSLLFFPIHGLASRIAPDATAYPHRSGIHLGIYALWTDRAQKSDNVAWVRQTWDAIQPFVPGGVYVNELGDDDGDDRVRQAYGINFARLQAIKAQYDPQNLFHLNANITPA